MSTSLATAFPPEPLVRRCSPPQSLTRLHPRNSGPPCSAQGPPRLRSLAFLGGALLLSAANGRADTASVVTAANTLIATSTAAGTSTSVQTSACTLAIAKQWTNLPGGTRNGPTIGGGPAARSTDLSAAVPSGQTISPRAAAIALAQTALSDFGYDTMNEIRHADDVIRATDNTQSWNYGNYHIAILGTPSTTSPWMLQISGHHLTAIVALVWIGARADFWSKDPGQKPSAALAPSSAVANLSRS